MKSESIGTYLLWGLALVGVMSLGACQSSRWAPRFETPIPETAEIDLDRPPTANTLYRMGKMLAAQNGHRAAEAVFSTRIVRYPTFIPAYVEVADLRAGRRDYNGAIDILEQALERVPQSAVIHNNLGMLWLLADDYEQALGEFATAVEQSPADGRFLANNALALAMTGRYEEALDAYMQVVEAGAAHFNVGIVAAARDDQKRAAHEFDRARSLGYVNSR